MKLVKLLKEYILEQKKTFFKYGKKVDKNTFVITNQHTRPMINPSISILLQNTLKRVGLGHLVGHFTAHTFRHMYASYLLNSGTELTQVSAALGHSNPRMTLSIYSEKDPEKNVNLADKFNNLW